MFKSSTKDIRMFASSYYYLFSNLNILTRWNLKKIGLEARKAKIAAAKEEFLAQIEAQKE